MVKKLSLSLMGVLIVLYAINLPLAWGEIKEGAQLGNVQFSKPLSADDQKYLGLSSDGPFTLSQVNAPYVLVEIFGSMCTHCMAQAPTMNKFYNLVSQDAKLAGKLKFIALGSNDNPIATTMFRKTNKMPFPAVADEDGSITKKFDIPGTPTTVILDKSGKVVLVHVGAFENPDEFLKQVKSKLKL
jgi:peroxiredoxin